MASSRPAPNPHTVEALLDTTWRIAGSEGGRTDTLDRKAATLATFASLVLSLVATLGRGFLQQFPHAWALGIYLLGLGFLVAAIGLSILVLLPKEQLTLGMDYLERFPRWSEILKPPEQVRGETMRGLLGALARERALNRTKAQQIRWAFLTLLAGLAVVAVEAAILGVNEL